LTDWSNAYSSTKTPLAYRLVEEYNRSFYLSKKSKLGYTSINSIFLDEHQSEWERLEDKPDIIRIVMDSRNRLGNRLSITIEYEVMLPDAKFTGYGQSANGDVLLRFWYIALSPRFNEKWVNYSHLNLDDFSIQSADYNFRLTVPQGVKPQTNLDYDKTIDNVYYFSGQKIRELILFYTKNKPFTSFKINEHRSILTNIFDNKENKEVNYTIVKRIDDFVTETFYNQGENKFLVPSLIYNKNPFFGLNDLPKFLAPFNNSFLEEISFLKSFLHFYLSSNLFIDLRKDHWVIGGLQTYLIIKYIERYYPQEKYLGRVSNFKLMKAYNLADIDFNESFWMYYEFMERSNLQQSDLLSKEKLIKFNEKIGSPYHVGIGLRYLENYLGKETLDKVIKDFFNQTDDKRFSLLDLLYKHSSNNIDWFEQFYLKERLPIDIKIKTLNKTKDSIHINLTKYSNNKVPFLIAQIKDEKIISQQWIENMDTASTVILENLNPDYLAINPEIRLPETNKNNNWRYVKNFLNIKPLHFNFLRDYESPKRNQIFYNPVVNYNLYDGLSIGSRFYDKGLLTQKFIFELNPQYSSIQDDLVGKIMFSYRINNMENSNYTTLLSFYGSSYHYMKSLRYQVINPKLNFYFRTNNFRSNKLHVLGLYYYSVKRDKYPDPITSPNYDLFNLRYKFSNRGALKYITLGANFQYSKKFGKIDLTLDYRKLLFNGTQFTARLFAGKFLYHNQQQTKYFDFNLNRPQDYLFRYNYFGRSEQDGFFSQQIVMAEGGFKSKLPPTTGNDYLITTNLTIGVWKWIESYIDFGIIKNQNKNPHFLYASGIRLNILPDYLELFFPFHSMDSWEFDGKSYETKIRFILTLNPKQLGNLFSRRWF
tara:strand:- start:1231 stop:3855 length:2625 start_codon:yes stop_codon:yes gene_type:complete